MQTSASEHRELTPSAHSRAVRLHRFLATAVLINGIAIIASPPVAEAKERPDLSGVWVLNDEVSDDVQEKLAGMDQPPGTDPGGGGFGVGGTGGRGGVGGGGSMDDRAGRPGMDPDAMRARMEVARAAASHLDVRWDEPVLTTIGARGKTQVLQIDGDQRPTNNLTGQSFPAKAKWKGNRLIVTWKRDGTWIREIWQLGARGTQLYITVEVPGDSRSRPIEIRRVYDKQSGDSADSSP